LWNALAGLAVMNAGGTQSNSSAATAAALLVAAHASTTVESRKRLDRQARKAAADAPPSKVTPAGLDDGFFDLPTLFQDADEAPFAPDDYVGHDVPAEPTRSVLTVDIPALVSFVVIILSTWLNLGHSLAC